jgi:dihydroorotase
LTQAPWGADTFPGFRKFIIEASATASKFLLLGLALDDVIAKVTSVPASAIGKDDIGTLRVGACGDAALFDLQTGSYTFHDSNAEARMGHVRLLPMVVVKGGAVYADYRRK